jgi:hypothetical protein
MQCGLQKAYETDLCKGHVNQHDWKGLSKVRWYFVCPREEKDGYKLKFKARLVARLL